MVQEKEDGPSRVCCRVSSHRRQMKLKAAGKLKKLQKRVFLLPVVEGIRINTPQPVFELLPRLLMSWLIERGGEGAQAHRC